MKINTISCSFHRSFVYESAEDDLYDLSMLMDKSSLSHITLLHWYFKFLSVAMFFDDYAKHKIMTVNKDLQVKTWEKSWVKLDNVMVQKTLAEIYTHPDKKNIFWYLATISWLRWVFSVTKDLMHQDRAFDHYLKKVLDDQFYAFQKILFFCRNVLSHHMTADIILAHEEYEQQLFSLRTHSKKVLTLEINYKKLFGAEWKWSADYWFIININTHKILSWQKYTSVISRHDQWLLAELCYNLSENYRKYMPEKKQAAPRKTYSTTPHRQATKRVAKKPRTPIRKK